MTVTKENIREGLYTSMGMTKEDAYRILETLLELMKGTLAEGEDILLSGFGKFDVKAKTKRRGRNPSTGEDLMLSARRVVTFKCSSVLKEKMNPQRVTKIRK